MEKFQTQSLPKVCKYLEKMLEKNPKDEVYCVGNKVCYCGLFEESRYSKCSFSEILRRYYRYKLYACMSSNRIGKTRQDP